MAFVNVLSERFAPERLAFVKSAKGRMASSRLALLRFWFLRSAAERFIFLRTASSKQDLKHSYCPWKSISLLFSLDILCSFICESPLASIYSTGFF